MAAMSAPVIITVFGTEDQCWQGGDFDNGGALVSGTRCLSCQGVGIVG
jgi:hypothetical protein